MVDELLEGRAGIRRPVQRIARRQRGTGRQWKTRCGGRSERDQRRRQRDERR